MARRAVTATKTDTPLMETPQSITVITRDRMELRGAQSVQQAVGYTAGVTAAAFGVDNRGDSVKIRGADSTQYLDGLLNSVGFYNNTRPDPYALERIEVLKGPSGMLAAGAPWAASEPGQQASAGEAARDRHQLRQLPAQAIQADLTGPMKKANGCTAWWRWGATATPRSSTSGRPLFHRAIADVPAQRQHFADAAGEPEG